jgi:hypothetical protein
VTVEGENRTGDQASEPLDACANGHTARLAWVSDFQKFRLRSRRAIRVGVIRHSQRHDGASSDHSLEDGGGRFITGRNAPQVNLEPQRMRGQRR